ncbi:MAG: hypothetical protein IJL41_01165 [Clostridia bacterium]|nr:hypothetical protein [Clostridia bacterium]
MQKRVFAYALARRKRVAAPPDCSGDTFPCPESSGRFSGGDLSGTV